MPSRPCVAHGPQTGAGASRPQRGPQHRGWHRGRGELVSIDVPQHAALSELDLLGVPGVHLRSGTLLAVPVLRLLRIGLP